MPEFVGPPRPRTIVYVDGFNLYQKLLRGTRYKWLDLFRLFRDQILDKSTDLIEVRFYTAPVIGEFCDDKRSPGRQQVYQEALKRHPGNVVIIPGKMQPRRRWMRLVADIPPHLHSKDTVQVQDLTEKKSDVALASDLICDGVRNRYDQAVLCSNDTDFEPALIATKNILPEKRFGLVAPIPRSRKRFGRIDEDPESTHIATELERAVDWAKQLKAEHVEIAQLPKVIQVPSGWKGQPIAKPLVWYFDQELKVEVDQALAECEAAVMDNYLVPESIAPDTMPFIATAREKLQQKDSDLVWFRNNARSIAGPIKFGAAVNSIPELQDAYLALQIALAKLSIHI